MKTFSAGLIINRPVYNDLVYNFCEAAHLWEARRRNTIPEDVEYSGSN